MKRRKVELISSRNEQEGVKIIIRTSSLKIEHSNRTAKHPLCKLYAEIETSFS